MNTLIQPVNIDFTLANTLAIFKGSDWSICCQIVDRQTIDNEAIDIQSSNLIKKDIEFENINAGMEHESEGTVNDLAWISGYVPAENLEEFKAACAANSWAVAYADPDDEDVEVIYSESFSKDGFGQAVMNRLLKAAGFHVIKR